MTVLSANLIDLGFLDASVIALLGYATVFFGLILLMFVVILLGKAFTAAQKRKEAATPAAAEEVTEEAPKPTAPGTAGQLMLHNVDPKTAAMLMAIVANKLDKPLNELRFISIKEVD